MFKVMAAMLMAVLPGCSVMSSGPGMMKEIAGGVRAIGAELASKFDPKEMTAGVNGQINDPRFEMQLIMSTGIIVEMELALVGADTGFDLQGAGTGTGINDPELVAQLNDIWSTPGASEDVRKLMITEAVVGWLKGAVAAPTEPASTPEP